LPVTIPPYREHSWDGTRKSTLSGRTHAQADLSESRLQLLKTKNGSPRTISLNSVAIEALEAQKLKTGGGNLVFLSANGQPFQQSPVRRWLEIAAHLAPKHLQDAVQRLVAESQKINGHQNSRQVKVKLYLKQYCLSSLFY
jgi:integrase